MICVAQHVPYLLSLVFWCGKLILVDIWLINLRFPLYLNSSSSPNIALTTIFSSSKVQRFQRPGNNAAHPKVLGHVWPKAKYLGHNRRPESRRPAKSAYLLKLKVPLCPHDLSMWYLRIDLKKRRFETNTSCLQANSLKAIGLHLCSWQDRFHHLKDLVVMTSLQWQDLNKSFKEW